MAPLTRTLDDRELASLIGIKKQVDARAEIDDLLGPMEPIVPAKKEEPVRGIDRFLRILEWFGVAGLYACMTLFTAKLLGSQGTGISRWILTALGGIFEITKLTLIVEGFRRKNPAVVLTALVFMVISFSGSALNMLASWQEKVEAQAADPRLARISSLEADLVSLRSQRDAELLRLKGGSVEYRTDAKETRASLDAVQGRIDAKETELRGLQEAVQKASQDQGGARDLGFFGALENTGVLATGSAGRLEVWFRVLVAFALEAGGAVGIYLLFAKRRKA